LTKIQNGLFIQSQVMTILNLPIFNQW